MEFAWYINYNDRSNPDFDAVKGIASPLVMTDIVLRNISELKYFIQSKEKSA